jgi:hypothetical protein
VEEIAAVPVSPALARVYVGGVRASGDGLDQLDSWGLETTRALLRPSPVEVFTPA